MKTEKIMQNIAFIAVWVLLCTGIQGCSNSSLPKPVVSQKETSKTIPTPLY